jgi:hypothetical protein
MQMDRQLDEMIDHYESASALGGPDARDAAPETLADELLPADAEYFDTVKTGHFGRGDRPSYWAELWSAS